MPRWVKGFIIATVAAAVLVVVALLVGIGGHGPSRHSPSSGTGTIEAPEGHTPPVDHG